MSKVDQVRYRRAGLGLRGHNPELAYQGYTLYAPSAGDGAVHLIDMAGEPVHRWQLPYPPGLYGYLTEQGTLFYNGKVIVDPPERFIDSQPWKGGVVLEVDWDGHILWELRHPDHHHDGIKLRNGNLLLICLAALPDEVAARVQGGRPGTEAEGVIYADYFVEMTPDGETVWEWRTWEHMDPAEFLLTASQEERHEWTHCNTVNELADGNLIVSFRNISTVAIINRSTNRIAWTLGAPPLAQQHGPVELENGNILIFDNGTHRLDHNLPYSRVIEVDPVTKEIVWSYQESYPSNFFSPLISNATRLPNGNTLICEGSFGRIFEVTQDGEVVWEFINPHFHTPPDKPDMQPSNRVFRAFRYSEEQIERAASIAKAQYGRS
jgi:hypothetical protein